MDIRPLIIAPPDNRFTVANLQTCCPSPPPALSITVPSRSELQLSPPLIEPYSGSSSRSYRPSKDTTFDVKQLCKITLGKKKVAESRYRYHDSNLLQPSLSVNMSSNARKSACLAPLNTTCPDRVLRSSPEKQRLPSLRGMLATMAAHVTGSSYSPPSIKTTTDKSCEVGSLADSMQRLRAKSISEEQHFNCGQKPHDATASEYLCPDLEYDTILAIARSRIDQKDDVFGQTPSENCSQATDFIALHADVLPNGTKTDPVLVSEVLWDLQAEIQTKASRERPGVGDHAEIMEELRYATDSVASMVEDLKVLPMLDVDVLRFFDSYAPRFSGTAPVLMKRALVELRSEIREQEDDEGNKKRIKEHAQQEFKKAYEDYQRLIKSGKSSREIMEELKPQEPIDPATGKDELKPGVLQNQDQSPLLSKTTRDKDRDPEEMNILSTVEPYDQQREAYDQQRVDYDQQRRRGSSNDFPFPFSRELLDPAAWGVEIKNGVLVDIVSCSSSDSSLRTVPSRTPSPQKHRIVSDTIERSMSPTKKAKSTSRGMARPVKKSRRSAAPSPSNERAEQTLKEAPKTPRKTPRKAPKETPIKTPESKRKGRRNFKPATSSKRGVSRDGVRTKE